jgi:hypothetical protein
MALTIHLSAEAEKKLLERAVNNGQTLECYVQELLEREFESPLACPQPQGGYMGFKYDTSGLSNRQLVEPRSIAANMTYDTGGAFRTEPVWQAGPELSEPVVDEPLVIQGPALPWHQPR